MEYEDINETFKEQRSNELEGKRSEANIHRSKEQGMNVYELYENLESARLSLDEIRMKFAKHRIVDGHFQGEGVEINKRLEQKMETIVEAVREIIDEMNYTCSFAFSNKNPDKKLTDLSYEDEETGNLTTTKSFERSANIMEENESCETKIEENTNLQNETFKEQRSNELEEGKKSEANIYHSKEQGSEVYELYENLESVKCSLDEIRMEFTIRRIIDSSRHFRGEGSEINKRLEQKMETIVEAVREIIDEMNYTCSFTFFNKNPDEELTDLSYEDKETGNLTKTNSFERSANTMEENESCENKIEENTNLQNETFKEKRSNELEEGKKSEANIYHSKEQVSEVYEVYENLESVKCSLDVIRMEFTIRRIVDSSRHFRGEGSEINKRLEQKMETIVEAVREITDEMNYTCSFAFSNKNPDEELTDLSYEDEETGYLTKTKSFERSANTMEENESCENKIGENTNLQNETFKEQRSNELEEGKKSEANIYNSKEQGMDIYELYENLESARLSLDEIRMKFAKHRIVIRHFRGEGVEINKRLDQKMETIVEAVEEIIDEMKYTCSFAFSNKNPDENFTVCHGRNLKTKKQEI